MELDHPIESLNDYLLPRLKGLDLTQEFDSIQDIQEYLKNTQICFYFLTCPYCNRYALFSSNILDDNPTNCAFCGESEPIYKLIVGLEKVYDLKGLAIFQSSGDSEGEWVKEDERITRILLEQCIVSLATTIEVFLKDIYCITSNLFYVQHSKSLFSLFYDESRNDFLNIGKARKRYNNRLNINLLDFLNEDELNKLNLLMLKRNCIVHNLGIVDIKFKSQSGLDIKLKEQITISFNEIDDYINLIQKLEEGLYEYLNFHLKNKMKENLTSFVFQT